MVQRVNYVRSHSYNTTSNQVKIIKTPGGKLAFQYVKKVAKVAHCGDCRAPLNGLTQARPKTLRTLRTRDRRVSRTYGGSRCHKCVRNRIVRAFLIEEQKIVKKVLRSRKGAAADAAQE